MINLLDIERVKIKLYQEKLEKERRRHKRELAEKKRARLLRIRRAKEAKANHIKVKISLSKQTMVVSKGGKELHRWRVSTAKAGYKTPKGRFRPIYLEKMHLSKEYKNAPMPYSIFFKDGGYAIHGTRAIKRLGKRASHGCVRLKPKNAKKLYLLILKYGKINSSIEITD